MAETKTKMILNIRSQQFGNFKISFLLDSSTTFKELIEFIIDRLNKQGNQMKEAKCYSLSDSSAFEYLVDDCVKDFCSDNCEITFSEIFIQQQQIVPQFPDVHSKAKDFSMTPISNATPIQSVDQTPQKDQQPDQSQPQPQPQAQAQPQPQPVVQDNDEFYKNLYEGDKMCKREELKEMTEESMMKHFLLGLTQSPEQLLEKSIEESKVNQSEMIKIFIQFPQFMNPQNRNKWIVQKKWKLREFSDNLLLALQLQKDQYRALLFSERGAPFHHNLQLLNEIKCDQILDDSENVFVIFVRADNDSPEYPDIPANDGPTQIFIKYDGKTYTISLDLENVTVLQLKQKIQQKLSIQVALLSIFYAGKYLVNEKLVKEYGVMKESNLEVNISMSAQSVGDSGDNYYNPSLRLLKLQSEEGMRQFRSHLMAITKQESTDEFKISILGLLREITQNNAPLVASMKDLFDKRKLTMVQKLALEESYYCLFTRLLFEKCKYVPKQFNDQPTSLFEHSRIFFSMLLENAKVLLATYKDSWTKREKFIQLDMTCSISFKNIKEPIFLIQDDGKQVVVEKTEIEAMIKDKQTIQGIASFSNEKNLKQLQNDMQKVYKLQNFFKAEQQYVQWSPEKDDDLNQFNPIEANKYQQNETEWLNLLNDIQAKDQYLPLKIYKAMELKGKHELYLLTLNKNKKLNLYSGISKGVSSPLELYDVISGKTITEGAEQIAQNQYQGGGGDQESVKVSQVQLEEVITIEPKEAIVVLIDTSSSMNSMHFKKSISRIGAVKAFFKAFSDRTIAYNFHHVISLVTFDYETTLVCNFTEIFTQFKNFVEQITPQGMTLLFDSISFACDKLLELKKKYPNCILRILALTDGEDNRSKFTSEQVAQKIYNNNIIIDSFVVGDQCNDLKSITLANGGNCFYPQNLSEAMKLFEAETVLSVGIRKKKKKPEENVTTASLNEFKNKPFTESWDPIETPKEFNLPACNLNQNSISEILKEEQKIQSNQQMKRIIREIQYYQENSNQRIQIFPCKADLTFWKVVIIGPPSTPYHKGLFILYVQFTDKYPVEPPNIRFITPIYHCNINAHGRICHRVLDRDYTQDTTMKTILDCIYGLLLQPEPDDPLDMTIAMEFLSESEYDIYVYKATTKTQQFAQRPIASVVDDIFSSFFFIQQFIKIQNKQ